MVAYFLEMAWLGLMTDDAASSSTHFLVHIVSWKERERGDWLVGGMGWSR